MELFDVLYTQLVGVINRLDRMEQRMGKQKHHECPCHHELERIGDILQDLTGQVSNLVLLLGRATELTIFQVGDNQMPISGVPSGGKGTFQVTANGALQSGNVPAWTVDDAAVTLTPAADGMTVVAATSTADTNTSFNLTVTAVSSDGTSLTATANVPILPAPPAPATSLTINQIA